MFMDAVFTVSVGWKQSKCLSVDGWIKKRCSNLTMEKHYSIERKELWVHITWMTFKGIMLSEKKAKLKSYISYYSIYVIFSKIQNHSGREQINSCHWLEIKEQ